MGNQTYTRQTFPKYISARKAAPISPREAVTDNFRNAARRTGRYPRSSLCCPYAVILLLPRRIPKGIRGASPLYRESCQATCRSPHLPPPYTSQNSGYSPPRPLAAPEISPRTDCPHKR